MTIVSCYTAFSKASVGLFLLRFVNERWQQVAIWTCIGAISVWSLISKYSKTVAPRQSFGCGS